MYLAIDMGGTKTLLSVFDDTGTVQEQLKFPTPADYPEYLSELKNCLDTLQHKDFIEACMAVPGLLDRKRNVVKAFGNRPWENVPLQQDVAAMLNMPVRFENDSKLAALSEAQLLLEEFGRVLYVTISTGINFGLVVDGRLDKGLQDMEGGQILVEHDGKLTAWEDVASGRAIVERFGKRASEIEDEDTWRQISKDIATGMIDVIAIIQPEVIVVGGGVGTHFEKYGHLLHEELQKFATPMVPIPPLRQAKRAEEAVIYGCYVLLTQDTEDCPDHNHEAHGHNLSSHADDPAATTPAA